MANTKTYQLKINGIQESMDAVESLHVKLLKLEEKLKSLESAKVSIGSSNGGTSNASNISALSEEERIQKEINHLKEEGQTLDAKIVAAQDEIYKRVSATKDIYKETLNDQKQMAAQERLAANAYSNTIDGMKQKLADLKNVMNTTDLGDGDNLKKMAVEANNLEKELKEVAKTYNTIGSGNAAQNVQAITVTVGGVERQFSSAREATKTLNNELKAMAVQGKQGTEAFEELRQKLLELESTLNDAKRPMDDIMDVMESFTAIASVSKGLGAFFGVDDTQIQKSIQQLLALQTALKGMETISKQVETREGIGKWIAPFTTNIDKGTRKLLVYNRALLGTGTSARIASQGIKVLSLAVKGLVSFGVLAAVDLLIEGVMKLAESFKKTNDGIKKAQEVINSGTESYATATSEISRYQARLESFNGTKAQEQKLVKELNGKYGDALGNYKSLEKWMDVLTKKGAAYAEVLGLQARYQAAINEYTRLYVGLASGQLSYAEYGETAHQLKALAEGTLKEIEDISKKYGIFDYAPRIDENAQKTKKAAEEAHRKLTELELRLMKEGLNKKLRQLDEEERQTLNKLKENGYKNQTELKKIQQAYSNVRLKEINDYLKKLETSIREKSKEISQITFQINIDEFKNQVDELKNLIDEIKLKSGEETIFTSLFSEVEYKDITKGFKKERLQDAQLYEYWFNEKQLKKEADGFYTFLDAYIANKGEEVKAAFDRYNKGIFKLSDKEYYAKLSNMYEKEFAEELRIVRSYGDVISKTLSDSFERRLYNQDKYFDKTTKKVREHIEEQQELNKQRIKEEEKAALASEEARYQAAQKPLQEQQNELEETIKNFKARNKKEEESYKELQKSLEQVNAQMETQRQQHYTKMIQLQDEYNNKLKENDIQSKREISTNTEEYFNSQLGNFRDFQSKINDVMGRTPVYNTTWGIVNISKTKAQYKELEDATRLTMQNIAKEKAKLDIIFKQGLITPEAMAAIKQQLNDLETTFKQLFQNITNDSKQTIPSFVESIQGYISEAIGSFQTIMSAVWDAQDVQNDKEAEKLDKMNDILDKKLEEQQAIVEKHKDAIDSIEDELETARGDRREHLIDQLNAEMKAQREAQAQEKRIEKEKEALQKKQDELEKKRKKQQYHRDIQQAIVNGAMAVTMAAVNKWPVPAIPMMALAASTTAAQLAIMTSNKPYAKGGLLEGPSHKEGGIPVGRTGIEVEGREYVIRKKSTAPNLEVLDYINKSERKLNLEDFIEFYSSDKPRKVIQSTRTRFADGGALPTLRNDINIGDNLQRAFEQYSERPVVVDVREITSKQDNIRNIQVLAGLDS